MLRKPATIACILAPICFATATGALELEYVSHLPLYFPEISLTEPSGLAVAVDGSGFWIVSDETRTVFKMNPNGEIRPFLDRDDRMRDLEGVAEDAERSRLLMVSERKNTVIAASLSAPHHLDAVNVRKLPGPENLTKALKDKDDGLEGIAVNTDTGSIFVLKERKPRLLIEIAPSLDRILAVSKLDDILPEDEDVSGLTVDTARNGFWIVSDVGKSVHFLPFDDEPVATLDLFWRDGERKRKLDNVEGAALSPDGRYLFVLTDDDKKSRIVRYGIIDENAD